MDTRVCSKIEYQTFTFAKVLSILPKPSSDLRQLKILLFATEAVTRNARSLGRLLTLNKI